jgi:nitroimidazol reductase NimA-like FMN-containing flavoprotein (pyridoxamine 5'-phosphate oxidase superfamily)
MGCGTAYFVIDDDEKKLAFDSILHKFSPNHFDYLPQAMEHTAVIKIKIDEISGKQAGY